MNPNLRSIPREVLERELRRREESQRPKPLDKPDFQPLTSLILSGVAEMLSSGCDPKDFGHYVYTSAMETVYGKNFWSWHSANVEQR